MNNSSFRSFVLFAMTCMAPFAFIPAAVLSRIKIRVPGFVSISVVVMLYACIVWFKAIDYMFMKHASFLDQVFAGNYVFSFNPTYALTNVVFFFAFYFSFLVLYTFFYDKNSARLIKQNRIEVAEKPIQGQKVKTLEQESGQQVYLGLDEEKNKLYIDRTRLTDHSAYFGTTGSGKTNTILSVVESSIINKVPFLYLDIKGSSSLRDGIQAYCKEHDMPFKCFSVVDESMYYNPLKNGGQTAITDKIINLRHWDNEYYKSQAINFIQALVYFLQQIEVDIDLATIAKYMNAPQLRSIKLSDDKANNLRKQLLENLKLDHIKNLSTELDILINSEIGHLLSPNDNDFIDIYSSIKKGEAVYFLLQPLLFKNYTELLANAVLSDIKAVLSYGLKEKFKEYHLFIDEPFSVNITDGIKTLLAQARSTNTSVHIATQAPSDANQYQTNMLDVISNNINHLYIHRLNNPADAEFVAESVGTKQGYEITMQVDRESSGESRGTSKIVNEFKIHPETIKSLPTGKAVIVDKGRQSYALGDIRRSLIST
jgi:hypothetical protein